ncbi:fumarate hydratase [Rhodobacterales bacterium HKCCE2091]|nr:fumarate hydratase [Rhodobacterales bacterium HKCCE2091]
MAVHELSLPMTEADARRLRLGDQVRLSGEIFTTAGIPTHQRLLRCLDGEEELPFDLNGGALFHLGSLNAQDERGELTIRYMNPTTSTRFNDVMPRLIKGLGLRATGGKGGLDAACARAMQEAGCVYLSFLGGGAPIFGDGIRRISGIGWPEMISHYRLARIEVDRLGPLTVGITANGDSIYDRTADEAAGKRAAILDRMRAEREATEGRKA